MLCALLFVMVHADIILAQDITRNIEGKIVDSIDVPLIGVDILIESESLQGIRGASSNDNGYFHTPNLSVGIYKMSVSMIGFQKVVINDIHIALGATTSLGTIHLKTQSIETEEVIVSGNTTLIDPSSTEYGGILRSKEFKNLPLDRDYKSIVALLPMTNLSYFGDQVNFAGATGNPGFDLLSDYPRTTREYKALAKFRFSHC